MEGTHLVYNSIPRGAAATVEQRMLLESQSLGRRGFSAALKSRESSFRNDAPSNSL